MNSFVKQLLLFLLITPLAFSLLFAQSESDKASTKSLAGLLAQIELTKEQKNSIKTIMQAHQDEIKKLTNKGAFHKSRIMLMKAEKFDIQQAEEIIDATNALRKERQLKKMYMMHQVYHTLTAQQKAQVERLFNQQE